MPVFIVVFFLLLGCRETEIRRQLLKAEAPFLVDSQDVTAADREELAHVGPVSCVLSDRRALASENADRCKAKLQAQAKELGAHLIVLEQSAVGRPGCESCVRFEGSAYRLREP